MTDSTGVGTMRQLLVGQYEELKSVLTRRLGSEDLANDALHETFLRLERLTRLGVVDRPRQYLLAIATNIARMNFRRDRRWTDLSELDAAVAFVDQSPGPDQRLEARQDIEALQKAFDELTPRRRQIIVAARVNGIQLAEIAKQMNVSKTLVEKELRAALTSCVAKVNRNAVSPYGSNASRASKREKAAVPLPEGRGDDA
jgi:RNA polymerase sigma factor (sigma-70 family)